MLDASGNARWEEMKVVENIGGRDVGKEKSYSTSHNLVTVFALHLGASIKVNPESSVFLGWGSSGIVWKMLRKHR